MTLSTAVLGACLLAGFGGAAVREQPPPPCNTGPFLEDLGRGRFSPRFPNLDKCTDDEVRRFDTVDFPRALQPYLAGHPADRAKVLADVQLFYRESKNGKYADFSRSLEALETTGSKIDAPPPEPRSTCDGIDEAVASLKEKKVVDWVPTKDCSSQQYADLAAAVAPQLVDDLTKGRFSTQQLIQSVSVVADDEGLKAFAAPLQSATKGILASSILSAADVAPRDFVAGVVERLNAPQLSRDIDRLSRRLATERPPSSAGWAGPVAGLGVLLGLASLLLLFRNQRPALPIPPPPTGREEPTPGEPNRLDELERRLKVAHGRLAEQTGRVDTLLDRLEQLQESIAESTPRFQQYDERLKELEYAATVGPSPAARPVGSSDELAESRLDALELKIAELGQQPERQPAAPLDLERQALGEAWNKLRDHHDVTAALDAAAHDVEWAELRDALLVTFPQSVPEDLKPTFDTLVAPARDYNNLVSRLLLVPKVVAGQLPALPRESAELMRVRELATLLAMIQNSSLVADRLRFRVKSWIADSFLTFADLFLQRYQQAQMDGRGAALEPGVQIVRRILRIANLEPIEVTLAHTVFDSARHVGRSTTSDARYSDGVIMAVVRNGFVQGGREVIRQPEVIVNRLR